MDYVGIIKQRKIIDDKLYHRYFVDNEGREIGIPAGIYLTNDGRDRTRGYVTNAWIKKQFPDVLTFTFSYVDKSTQEKALKDMITACSALTKDAIKTCTRLRNKKNVTANVPNEEIDMGELPPGISFVDAGTRRCPAKSFTVSCYNIQKKGFFGRLIYIGTENTWRKNYAKCLKKAVTLREESLAIYCQLTKNQTK
jgi:hypothetical protein